MNDEDITILERLERQRGFRYHYSITNYCELLSHFEDDPSDSCPDPFSKYRRCFLKIVQLCYAEVLPSPEMEFLSLVGLEKYLHPAWIPDLKQTALGVEIAANAENLVELTGESNNQDQVGSVPSYVIKPGHYRKLRDTDGESFTRIMELLTEVIRPIKGSDRDKLEKLFVWFMKLAQFFFLVRPSNGKVTYDFLKGKKKNALLKRFMMALVNCSTSTVYRLRRQQ